MANALLSIDSSAQSAGIDVSNALSDLADRVSDIPDAIDEAVMPLRELRRHRARLEPIRRFESRRVRSSLAESVRQEMDATWQAQANAAYAAATRRRARWWRPASREDRRVLADARATLLATLTAAAMASEAELDAAEQAVAVAATRVPWWQRGLCTARKGHRVMAHSPVSQDSPVATVRAALARSGFPEATLAGQQATTGFTVRPLDAIGLPRAAVTYQPAQELARCQQALTRAGCLCALGIADAGEYLAVLPPPATMPEASPR